jgi:hypothetical protein
LWVSALQIEERAGSDRGVSLHTLPKAERKRVFLQSLYKQQGHTMIYLDRGDSGHPSYRHFCGSCGSPIITKVALMPGKVLVKAGTLDSMEGLQPQIEIYTDRSVKWLSPIDGVTRFARSP